MCLINVPSSFGVASDDGRTTTTRKALSWPGILLTRSTLYRKFNSGTRKRIDGPARDSYGVPLDLEQEAEDMAKAVGNGLGPRRGGWSSYMKWRIAVGLLLMSVWSHYVSDLTNLYL